MRSKTTDTTYTLSKTWNKTGNFLERRLKCIPPYSVCYTNTKPGAITSIEFRRWDNGNVAISITTNLADFERLKKEFNPIIAEFKASSVSRVLCQVYLLNTSDKLDTFAKAIEVVDHLADLGQEVKEDMEKILHIVKNSYISFDQIKFIAPFNEQEIKHEAKEISIAKSDPIAFKSILKVVNKEDFLKARELAVARNKSYPETLWMLAGLYRDKYLYKQAAEILQMIEVENSYYTAANEAMVSIMDEILDAAQIEQLKFSAETLYAYHEEKLIYALLAGPRCRTQAEQLLFQLTGQENLNFNLYDSQADKNNILILLRAIRCLNFKISGLQKENDELRQKTTPSQSDSEKSGSSALVSQSIFEPALNNLSEEPKPIKGLSLAERYCSMQ